MQPPPHFNLAPVVLRCLLTPLFRYGDTEQQVPEEWEIHLFLAEEYHLHLGSSQLLSFTANVMAGRKVW